MFDTSIKTDMTDPNISKPCTPESPSMSAYSCISVLLVMPDMSKPLISLYEFAKKEGWITEEEFQRKKKQIFFEQRVVPFIVIPGVFAWGYIFVVLLGA